MSRRPRSAEIDRSLTWRPRAVCREAVVVVADRSRPERVGWEPGQVAPSWPGVSDGRVPVATATDQDGWAGRRLQPTIDAELGWGNEIVHELHQDSDGRFRVTLAEPLHLDLLRDTFRFPPDVRLGGNATATWLVDTTFEVVVEASRLPGPHQPGPGTARPRRARTGSRRSSSAREPSLPGRGGPPGVEHGWPRGSLAPLHLWLDGSGRPQSATTGADRFALASGSAHMASAGVPEGSRPVPVHDLDMLVGLVPPGWGLLIDRGGRRPRAVRPWQLDQLRPHPAPSPGEEELAFGPVPPTVAGEVDRLEQALCGRGLRATVLWVRSARSQGLWIVPLAASQAVQVWDTVRAAELWPPSRLVDRRRLGWRENAGLVGRGRTLNPDRAPEVRAVGGGSSLVVAVAAGLLGLPPSVGLGFRDPRPGLLLAAVSVLGLLALLLVVLRRVSVERGDDPPRVPRRSAVVAAALLAAYVVGLVLALA